MKDKGEPLTYRKLTNNERLKKEAEYERHVADLFIKGMESNNLPWQKPWKPSENVRDYNLFTMTQDGVPKTFYRGMNGLLCETTRLLNLHSEDPRWCTMGELRNYNKSKEDIREHLFIKRGEKGLPIKFYNYIYFDEDGSLIKTKGDAPDNYSYRKSVLKTYTIFNACQIIKFLYDKDGKKELDENGEAKYVKAFNYTSNIVDKTNFQPIIKAEDIIKATNAVITYDCGDTCAYIPDLDKIHMVKPELFKSKGDYYDTLLHELTHWTGHPSRLNREEARRYNENDYWRAKEELVAEIGGYLLAKECNISFKPSNNNIAYVKSWMKDLKDDPESIFIACKKADQAQNYILSFSRNKTNEKNNELSL